MKPVSGCKSSSYLNYETAFLTRSYLLMNIPEEGENKLTDAKLQGYAAVLSIGSTRCKANLLGTLEDGSVE